MYIYSNGLELSSNFVFRHYLRANSEEMSTPQPNSQGQSQPYSQQLAQQYQQNQAQRYPYYTSRVHYAPSSLQTGTAGQASSSTAKQPGPTAQFLQAGMTGGQGGSGSSYQYPGYGQGAVRTSTPSNSTTSATGNASSTSTAGQGSATVNSANLPAHLQQYAHYFQNIQNLGSHFTGFNSGNYNYTPSTTNTYGQTGAISTATTGMNYNAAYAGTYGATGLATSTGAGYGTTTARAQRDDDEDLLPGMDDADYSAQSQYQSQSKADLK